MRADLGLEAHVHGHIHAQSAASGGSQGLLSAMSGLGLVTLQLGTVTATVAGGWKSKTGGNSSRICDFILSRRLPDQ